MAAMKRLVYTIAALFMVAAPAIAQQGAAEGGVGYGGARVQMQPLMVPIRSTSGQVRFEVLTVRISIAPGSRERPACFSVPIVHEKMLMYLYGANLKPGDLIGQRREVLANALLDLATKSTAKGYYSKVEFVELDGRATDLDPVSQTISNQCK
jgi:hypothetical protein